jgi:hypothetical protein
MPPLEDSRQLVATTERMLPRPHQRAIHNRNLDMELILLLAMLHHSLLLLGGINHL